MKRMLLIAGVVIIAIGVFVVSGGYHINRPNYGFFGEFDFIGSENKFQYVTMNSDTKNDSIQKSLYEYKDGELEEVFTYVYGSMHLIHDEIFGITSEKMFGPFRFVRIDIESREVVEISYTGDIKEHIDLGGFFDVIDDNDDVIILHQEYFDTIDGSYVNQHYVYVIDKQLDEITKMYTLDEYGSTHYETVNKVLLENEQIVFITNETMDSKDIVVIDYNSDQIDVFTQEQNDIVLYLNEKHCIVTKDHRLNNTCRTIPEVNVDSIIELTKGVSLENEVLYDGEFVYIKDFKSMSVYSLGGILLQENELEFDRYYMMYDDQELIYIHLYEQGSIFIRYVFEIVEYDPVKNEEVKRSKSFIIKFKYKSESDSV